MNNIFWLLAVSWLGAAGMKVISFESVKPHFSLTRVACLNGDESRGQWQQSVISK